MWHSTKQGYSCYPSSVHLTIFGNEQLQTKHTATCFSSENLVKMGRLLREDSYELKRLCVISNRKNHIITYIIRLPVEAFC